MLVEVNNKTYNVDSSDIIDDEDMEERYKDLLDECYGDVNIAGYDYRTSEALESVDPVAYRCGLADYISSDYAEARCPDTDEFFGYVREEELEELEEEEEELEEEE